MRNIWVLYSGGIDSTVVAHMAAQSGRLAGLVIVNYGQVAFTRQAQLGALLAEELSSPGHQVQFESLVFDYSQYYSPDKMPLIFQYGSKPTRHTRDDLAGDVKLPDVEDFCWMEGRNHLFILMASIHAAMRGASVLMTGFQYNQNEMGANVGPSLAACDTTVHTVDQINGLMHTAMSRPFRVESPLKGFDKSAIVRLANSMGIDLSQTHSCEYYPPCGICSQCQERESLGVKHG